MRKEHFLKTDPKILRLCADTLRFLSVDAVQKADSGHPGMPLGMADCAVVLWSEHMKYDACVPQWPNRDRFILSAGHGSMLLYSLLHLSGYAVTLEDLKSFRQWGSRTPGHPERNCIPGVEITTGPLGQGFANGVGMAIASKIMGAQYNTPAFSPIDHFIFGIVSDGDLMEGISSESASLAGHLQLENLIYIYDNNKITIEGSTALSFSENVQKRFESYGWHTVHINGHDYAQISDAIAQCKSEDRPSLIIADTHIGYGSPNKQDKASCHGAPLGAEEVRLTKKALGWPEERSFYVPEEVRAFFNSLQENLHEAYLEWQKRFGLWQKDNPALAELWTSQQDLTLPQNLEKWLILPPSSKPKATRIHSSEILQSAASHVPFLVGGSADLHPSTKTLIEKAESFSASHPKGRNLHFGIREHAMGGIMNGMSAYGGFIPYGSTFLVFSDYMRPSIRLAALMNLPVIYVFTHDSIFVGEDGPTHQPVEHIASLRLIPGVDVFRPADGQETAVAWAYAIRNRKGPTALILSRQNVPEITRKKNFNPKAILRGGYVLSEEEGRLDLVIVATGSELHVAVKSGKALRAKKKKVRIVSMPSLNVFMRQSDKYRESVVPPKNIPVVIIEAGVSYGWHAISHGPLLFLGVERFGASAPYEILAKKFNLTPETVTAKTIKWLETLRKKEKK